jgi:hypothetical protein
LFSYSIRIVAYYLHFDNKKSAENPHFNFISPKNQRRSELKIKVLTIKRVGTKTADQAVKCRFGKTKNKTPKNSKISNQIKSQMAK